jgi:hypothetical protein
MVQPAGRPVYQPHQTDAAVGGRININSNPVPFPLLRILPLSATLQGAPAMASGTTPLNPLSSGSAQALAENICNHTLATNGTMYNCPTQFISAGEICQVKGIADSGEQSEELIRQISNLTTARSGVFSIYSVGQALKQTPNGTLLVTGEQRIQSMVERVSTENPNNTGVVISFRPVYYRTLTP